MIDLSHLNEQGFWDVAALSDAPLVASHSNVHALTPHSRNLTDRQLDAIRESDGLVGINFGTMFIRADGRKDPDTPLDELVRHIDYLVDRIGIDRVGLGSDFDGTTVPADLKDASHLPALVSLLRSKGYDDVAVRKICSDNWIRVLEETWGR
jgi:membrane dipeptidase